MVTTHRWKFNEQRGDRGGGRPLSTRGRVPGPAPPTEPQSLGSHYLDKYICPVDQPVGPFPPSLPPEMLSQPRLHRHAPGTRPGLASQELRSVSLPSSAHHQAAVMEQLSHGVTSAPDCPG